MWVIMGHSGASWEMMAEVRRRSGRVFLGEYSHSLDGKGRVVMPSKFRPELADGCVVTKGQERCVYVFPMERWGEESSKVLTTRGRSRAVVSKRRQKNGANASSSRLMSVLVAPAASNRLVTSADRAAWNVIV